MLLKREQACCPPLRRGQQRKPVLFQDVCPESLLLCARGPCPSHRLASAPSLSALPPFSPAVSAQDTPHRRSDLSGTLLYKRPSDGAPSHSIKACIFTMAQGSLSALVAPPPSLPAAAPASWAAATRPSPRLPPVASTPAAWPRCDRVRLLQT